MKITIFLGLENKLSFTCKCIYRWKIQKNIYIGYEKMKWKNNVRKPIPIFQFPCHITIRNSFCPDWKKFFGCPRGSSLSAKWGSTWEPLCYDVWGIRASWCRGTLVFGTAVGLSVVILPVGPCSINIKDIFFFRLNCRSLFLGPHIVDIMGL